MRRSLQKTFFFLLQVAFSHLYFINVFVRMGQIILAMEQQHRTITFSSFSPNHHVHLHWEDTHLYLSSDFAMMDGCAGEFPCLFVTLG